MKKLFFVLALTGMVGAVSATSLSTVNGNVIVFNGGDGDGKKKEKEKDKKACKEGEKSCCKKDGATGAAATTKDGKTCTEGEKSGKSCCKKGETEKKTTAETK